LGTGYDDFLPTASASTLVTQALRETPSRAALTRKIGRYDMPVFCLGRLAIDRARQGQGLGGDLLLAAGERALAVAAEVAGVALAIDAKDEKAARWYERFGALALRDDPLKLIFLLGVIADAIITAGKQRK
jgi:GNAT superfamily N-acetyltransferase